MRRVAAISAAPRSENPRGRRALRRFGFASGAIRPSWITTPPLVMAGLVPAIHVFLRGLKTWMPGTRACPGLDPGPGMTNEAWSCARLVSQRLGGDKAGPSAADLKFLHRLRQTHFRNFKSTALAGCSCNR